MEGGIRRGFVQKGQVEGLYFDQSVVFRPLPALPPGSEWVKRDDGLYYIVETRELTVVVGGNGAEPEDTEAPAAAKIPTHKDAPGAAAWHGHVVLESDTIAGLCVRYGVKRRELLILNFLEKDHELKGRTNLKIPCRDRKDPTIRQVQTDEVVLQLFRNATGLGKIEAKIYLDLAKWDLNSAIDKARADDYFEECARPEAKVFAESRSVSPDSVMVHLDCARGLVDVGLLQSMDVYVVAVLVAGGDVARSQSAAAAASKEGVWAWSAAQQGSTLELAHKALEAKGVGVRFEVYAANDVVADTLVGSTASVPLERLSDGALHVVEVDTGGELSLSLGAPAHVKSKSEFVRAVAVPANPFDAFDAARAAVSIPLVTAVEVRADYDAPGGLPPPPASPCVTSPFDFMNEPNPS